jgi:regulator of sigma E protease
VTGAISLDQARNPLVAVPRAVEMTIDFTRIFLVGLGKLATGEVSSKNLAGPIGIAQMAGSAYEQGWDSYLRLMILISINLGILNLLPIPVLDGGQATLFIIEGVRRSPLSLRSKIFAQQIGVTVLVLLMGLAFWNDLTRVWAKVVDWLPSGF